MSPPPVMMFGRSGQVARAVAERAPAFGHAVTALCRDEADLTDAEALRQAINAAPPGAVILNAAAYTAVDQAESEPETAKAVNADAPGIMARAAHKRGLRFIHLSTDYVFDGEKAAPYAETDPTAPRSVYGATKKAGEDAVLDAHPGAVVVRTAWVYSPFGKNFLKTMLRVGAEREALRIVDDQIGAPTSAHDIADGLFALIAAPHASGLFHLTGAGRASWADFAEAIFERQAAIWGRRPRVERITTAQYPTPATRPANSQLDCSRLKTLTGYEAPPWRDSLAAVLDRLNAPADAL